MFLFTLVLAVLFLPQADNLKCKCESGPFGICSEETTECPSHNDRCSVVTQVGSVGDKVSEIKHKGCMMSELCLDYSVNYGAHRVAQTTSCCSGDLCNAQIDYPKAEYKSNGRKCFSCEGENCMKTLNCVGDENYCIKVTGIVQGLSLTLKGCASELLCSDQFSSLLNQSASQFTGAKVSCCQGDYCNSASSAGPTLLLLLVPLLFSALFP